VFALLTSLRIFLWDQQLMVRRGEEDLACWLRGFFGWIDAPSFAREQRELCILSSMMLSPYARGPYFKARDMGDKAIAPFSLVSPPIVHAP
jgi:hypothetical protein